MMVKVPRLVTLVLAMFAGLGVSQAAQSTKAAPAPPAKKPAAAKPKTSTASKSPAKKKSRTTRAAAPTQTAPSPDRMREIQEALTKQGFPVEATGTLGPETADALKRFQAQQKLEPTGKINSLTLISLGLGPKREAATAQAYPPEQKD